ncbi:hypothetical protein L204_102960 [Cryptococcus depauperatus]
MPDMSSSPNHQPEISVPYTESAVFRHSPKLETQLKREWEPGCQSDELYDVYLPAWRASIRRFLVRRLRNEKEWMADWQKATRSEARDTFFYWSAIFGTHTFFMMFLPVLFFFGRPMEGRGLLNLVGLGIYISSFTKDLVCTPRPYSPPVIRLTMSTHHHEYGFPSSHSTNSISIALFFGQWLYQARQQLGWPVVASGWAILAVYALSVIGGRVYTGMHSTADVLAGSIMGIICWMFWTAVGDSYEAWVISGSWIVPAVIIPLGLVCIHYHPEPMDDCPCFEDAIAVLAVMLGGTIGHWASVSIWPVLQSRTMPPLFQQNALVIILVTVFRLVFGLGALFAWRIVAKATLLKILPPIFRSFSSIFRTSLPTRRFYKAATEYQTVPPHLGFRTIPSMLDLQTGENDAAPSSPHLVAQTKPDNLPNGLRRRNTDKDNLQLPNGNAQKPRPRSLGWVIQPKYDAEGRSAHRLPFADAPSPYQARLWLSRSRPPSSVTPSEWRDGAVERLSTDRLAIWLVAAFSDVARLPRLLSRAYLHAYPHA